MYISDLLTAGCIELAADVKTKEEAIARLVELFEKNGIVTDKALFGSLGVMVGVFHPLFQCLC